MAYLGRKGASAALTSSDIPDGSISAVKVAADVATQAEIDLKANLASPTLVTPTIANMANCTFPSTHPDITIFRPDWSSNINGTTETTAGAYQVWTNKRASSTVHVELTFHWSVYRDSGAKTFRTFYAHLYYSTSSVADAATSSLGTELARVTLGRRLEGDNAADMNSYGTATIQGAFTSGSAGTNYYIGVTHHSIESSVISIFYGGGTGDASGSQLKVIEV